MALNGFGGAFAPRRQPINVFGEAFVPRREPIPAAQLQQIPEPASAPMPPQAQPAPGRAIPRPGSRRIPAAAPQDMRRPGRAMPRPIAGQRGQMPGQGPLPNGQFPQQFEPTMAPPLEYGAADGDLPMQMGGPSSQFRPDIQRPMQVQGAPSSQFRGPQAGLQGAPSRNFNQQFPQGRGGDDMVTTMPVNPRGAVGKVPPRKKTMGIAAPPPRMSRSGY